MKLIKTSYYKDCFRVCAGVYVQVMTTESQIINESELT